MKLSVHQRGGFAGLDRQVEIEGNVVTVTDKRARGRPPVRQPARLAPAQQRQVEVLATRVAAVSDKVVPSGGYLPPDAVVTSIAIEQGDQRHDLRIVSGDDVPGEVWELLGLVREVAEAE